MCLGDIDVLDEAWEIDGTRIGRLGCGAEVTLAFVPDAAPGSYLLVHLGVPVEVLTAEAAQTALQLRADHGGEPWARSRTP
jgi:hydrogenase maturation factor